MAKKVKVPEHLVDSNINKLAQALVEQIRTKSLDIDGQYLTYEQGAEIAVEVIKGQNK